MSTHNDYQKNDLFSLLELIDKNKKVYYKEKEMSAYDYAFLTIVNSDKILQENTPPF